MPRSPAMSIEIVTSCRTIWLSSVRIQISPLAVALDTSTDAVVAVCAAFIFSASFAWSMLYDRWRVLRPSTTGRSTSVTVATAERPVWRRGSSMAPCGSLASVTAPRASRPDRMRSRVPPSIRGVGEPRPDNSRQAQSRPSNAPQLRLSTVAKTVHNRKGPPNGGPFSPAEALLRGLLLVQGFLVDLEDRLVLRRDREWDHPRDEPLGPHLVDLVLEVLHILVGEVREAPLALQVLIDRFALLPPLRNLAGRAGEVAHAVHDLVERPDPALDGEVTELLRVLRVVVPTLRARVEGVDERRPAELERLADLIHEIHGVRGASRGDVPRLGVAGGEHTRHVLLPAGVHEALLRARRRERRHRAVRRLARELDVGVRVRLVVVEQDEAVVVLVRERRGDRAEAHVRAAAVAAEGDDVDLLVLDLALAHEHLEAGRRAERRGARRAELGMHPRHDPGCRVVGRVGDIHASGRAEDDRARARRFHHVPHDERGLTPLTGPVSGHEELVVGDVLDALDLRKGPGAVR